MAEFSGVVDVEALLYAHFKASPNVTALAGTRISTDLPKDFGEQSTNNARLQFRRSGGAQVNAHVDRPLVDFYVYGNTRQGGTSLLAMVVLAIQELTKANRPEGVVTQVERVSSPIYDPDPDTDTPRYLFTYALVTHPRPA